ncbi:O-succinylbenzoic acid--CoA ligase [Vibrio ichthyoenteri ATCC 700023]|uniref:O-succinylbenzoic acid--CoA ligase n=1 Tax=Vibrio ichthyoenteri ATCC 700023 TaxID=870968 RepID=F9RZ86_9VIBR|nr:o-succinylbenzoate--CoA ligase [Vibrio ichthyoenteri]EGU45710.1 O-succinylbenzoic acid--CoA ligase [Vibrio ichthyoenteri ATCC 700023]
MHRSPLKHWALMSPDCLALVTPQHQYTWSELDDVVTLYARTLSFQHVTQGSVVTCVGKNSVEMLLIYLACGELGAICALTTPQPYALLADKLETLYLPDQVPNVWGAESDARLEDVTRLELTDLEDISHTDKASDRSAYHLDSFASIIFTSGSMGKPKAVVHSHAQHLASAQGLLEPFHFEPSDCWLLSLPMYHVSGLAIVYRWLAAGAQLKVGCGDLLQDIQGVTHASLVATQLERLLSCSTVLNLSHVLLGGSHVPLALSQQAAEQGIETWLGYGMTEAASTVTAKQIDATYSAGTVLPNHRLELREGRIYIGGETLASGYFEQGVITPITDAQGWFDSKDLGERLANGELVIKGRADNQFISGGENIHCEEIEAALNQMDEITQSIVVPIADEEFGQRPVAVLQAAALPVRANIEQHLEQILVKFKWPVAYLLLPESLLGSGIKVSRKQVKDWLATQSKDAN